MKKTLSIIFLSILVSTGCALSVENEKAKENQTTCFYKADKNLHEAIKQTGMDMSNFDKYVKELQACQDKFQDSDEEYLGEDYNKCMREANKAYKDERKECRQMKSSNERKQCYSDAKDTHSSSRSSCERIGHSDNAAKIWGK